MWGGEEGRRSPTLALYDSQQQAACRGQWKRGYGAIGLLAVRQLLWMSLVAPHSEKVNRRRHGRCCRGRRATEILVVLLTFIPCGVNPENEFSSPFILVLMTLCKPTATTEWRHCSLVWLGKWKPAAVVCLVGTDNQRNSTQQSTVEMQRTWTRIATEYGGCENTFEWMNERVELGDFRRILFIPPPAPLVGHFPVGY